MSTYLVKLLGYLIFTHSELNAFVTGSVESVARSWQARGEAKQCHQSGAEQCSLTASYQYFTLFPHRCHNPNGSRVIRVSLAEHAHPSILSPVVLLVFFA